MSISSESGLQTGRRLSTLAAALVIARRDFSAILLSRSFIFFLLGPLFPVLVAMAAGSVGHKVQQAAERPVLGIAMSEADNAALIAASTTLEFRIGYSLPGLSVIQQVQPGEKIDAPQLLKDQQGDITALLTGTLHEPVLTGNQGQITEWQGPISLLAEQALDGTLQTFPTVKLTPTTAVAAKTHGDRMRTAQGGQTLLFLLTMLLAGMVAAAAGFSLVAITTLAATAGAALPLLFDRLGLDPALMSAPFIATATDVAGVFIYLQTAAWLLQRAG